MRYWRTQLLPLFDTAARSAKVRFSSFYFEYLSLARIRSQNSLDDSAEFYLRSCHLVSPIASRSAAKQSSVGRYSP